MSRLAAAVLAALPRRAGAMVCYNRNSDHCRLNTIRVQKHINVYCELEMPKIRRSDLCLRRTARSLQILGSEHVVVAVQAKAQQGQCVDKHKQHRLVSLAYAETDFWGLGSSKRLKPRAFCTESHSVSVIPTATRCKMTKLVALKSLFDSGTIPV